MKLEFVKEQLKLVIKQAPYERINGLLNTDLANTKGNLKLNS